MGERLSKVIPDTLADLLPDERDLIPSEEPPDKSVEGQPTLPYRVIIATKLLPKLKEPRKGLSRAVQQGQIKMGI